MRSDGQRSNCDRDKFEQDASRGRMHLRSSRCITAAAAFTRSEMMATGASRVFHAPYVTLIYERETVGTAPDVPLPIGDSELRGTSVAMVPVPKMFRYGLQGGLINVGLLVAAQLDKIRQYQHNRQCRVCPMQASSCGKPTSAVINGHPGCFGIAKLGGSSADPSHANSHSAVAVGTKVTFRNYDDFSVRADLQSWNSASVDAYVRLADVRLDST